MKKDWDELYDFFDILNKNVEYVILRNWDEHSFEDILNGKDDIDILCYDKMKIVDIIGGISLHHNFNRSNYYVDLGTRRIRVDIRYIGDGYYCRKWEEKLLERRVLSEMGFYVLDTEDYFYSLLYHALIQKPRLSSKYCEKLNAMVHSGNSVVNEEEFLCILQQYMDKNRFYVEHPSDCAVFLNRKNIRVGKLTIERNVKRELLRTIYPVHKRMSKLLAKIMF